MADERNDEPKDSNDDGMTGQPIGGNDSSTGTGTTLTQGADFDASLGNDKHFGLGTTSNAGGSTVGSDQTSGGSSGVSGGKGFVGAKGDDSSDYLRQERGSPNQEDDESAADSD